MAAIYITEQGATLGIDHRRLEVRKDGEVVTEFPMGHVTRVVILGNVHITTPTLKRLMREGIDLTFLSMGGQYYGRITGELAPHIALRRAQYHHQADPEFVLALAQRGASAIKNASLYSQAQQAAMLEERQRLARELHDAVTQTLFSAGIIADVLPRLWQKDQEEALKRINELRELTRGALAEMRTLLWELRPTALSETSLSELLHQLGEVTVGRTRIPVTVDVKELCEIPINVKIAFYRIAQEALNNIAKHANARHVKVDMQCAPAGVSLHIADDGRGFDLQQLLPDNMGIRIMRERAEAVGAIFNLESHVGTGTQIVVSWLPTD